MQKLYIPECEYENIVDTYYISKVYDMIDDTCFWGCENLKYIKIPDNIRRIGYSAFFGCDNLKSIKMTDSVNFIDICAFYGCPKLDEIYLSDNVELNGKWFDKDTNPNCKVYHIGHVYTVEDIRLYY